MFTSRQEFEDALRGAPNDFTLRQMYADFLNPDGDDCPPILCKTCNGRGCLIAPILSPVTTCPVCGGPGDLRRALSEGYRAMSIVRPVLLEALGDPSKYAWRGWGSGLPELWRRAHLAGKETDVHEDPVKALDALALSWSKMTEQDRHTVLSTGPWAEGTVSS